MKQRILTVLAALAMVLSPALMVVEPVSAACGTQSDAKTQVLNGVGETSHDCSDSGVKNAIKTVSDILSYVVGVAAVFAILSGGFKYITSGGEASKVGNAKHTIMYALVGIVIVVLAQLIVRVVISDTSTAVTSCPTGQHHQDATDNLSACVT